jgi:dihydrodipicolinate synthase/N-acetylneuraminate lyase
MDRSSINWRGYIPAVTTPFCQNGVLDTNAAKRLYDWLYEQGMHGLIIMGTQGEWFSLSKEEKKKLLKIAGQQLSGKITLIAGCNAYSATEAIENIEIAHVNGFNGILLTPPPYIVPTESEILAFYEEVNAASTLPICIYNWPPGTNIDMSLTLLSMLAELDKVVAIKNSTSNPQHFLDVFYALKDKVRIFGVPMNEQGIKLVLEHDADGTMGAGAVLGSEQPDFFNSIWKGDIEKAITIGNRDQILMRAWFNSDYTGKFGSAQAIFKEALNQQGLPGGYLRRPILPLNEEGVKCVRATLIKLNKIQE